MITVVTFLWKPPATYRSQFEPGHVNALYEMVRRNYASPFRFVCFTDVASGFRPEVETVPLVNTWKGFKNPTWADGPGCYPRLELFNPAVRSVLGDRFISLDLDCVVTGPLESIIDKPGEFLIWRTHDKAIPVCASMFAMDTGTRAGVWECFEGQKSIDEAKHAGFRGSDQAWIMCCLGTNMPGWSTADGVYQYSRLIPQRPDARRRRFVHHVSPHSRGRRLSYGADGAGPLPPDARLVFFTGKPDPWDDEALRMSPWIAQHYPLEFLTRRSSSQTSTDPAPDDPSSSSAAAPLQPKIGSASPIVTKPSLFPATRTDTFSLRESTLSSARTIAKSPPSDG